MMNMKLKNKQGGYSLVEMAIALMILGLLIAPIYALYQKYLVIQAQEITQRNIIAVTEAINSHRFANGQFPCPAPLNVGRGDNGYGLSTDCADTSVATGNFANGYSVIQAHDRNGNAAMSGDIFDSDGVDVTGNATALDDVIRVRRGAIPFVDLGLSEQTALDGYGNKIVYAVTELLADPVFISSYPPGMDPSFLGGINVVDENGESTIYDDDTLGTTTPLTQYIVFSHGPDGAGAYRQDGVLVSACPGGQNQSVNCNLTSGDATFSNSVISTTGNANQSDDVVRYYNRSQNTDAWQLSAANSNDIHLKPQVLASFNEFDIGTVSSGDDDYSNVDGRILAEDVAGDAFLDGRFIASMLMADDDGAPNQGNICDSAGNDCVNISVLAQADDTAPDNEKILCDNDPNQPYMTGIVQNNERCTGVFEVSCPRGSYVYGFDSNGRPQCDRVPCRATQVDICGTLVDIPEMDQGSTFWTPTAGDSRRLRYVCNSDAEWELDATISGNDDIFDDGSDSDGVRGVCTCNPINVTVPIGCNDTVNNKWTNNGATQTTTTTDSALCSRTTTNTRSTMCECLPHTRYRYPSCAVGSGTYVQEADRGCNAGGNHYWIHGWQTTDTSGCSCTTTTSTYTACVSPQSGTGITQNYTVNCATGARTPDGPPTGTCTCDSTSTRETVDPCPAGEIGTGIRPGQIYTETYSCANARWERNTPGTPDQYNCQPIPPGTFIWVQSSVTTTAVATRAGRPQLGSDCTVQGSTNVCMIAGAGFAARSCKCMPNPNP